ncbi:alpha/beta hydrolase [Virgibacillus ihumii]|uniref:alpha/beta hydrolase n=1 Tax=Virgibacillus ihumii TaxID=2686091 RepID=UPI001FE45747|nr:alpha/beta hydrolase [Virgibacillus ihumii]
MVGISKGILYDYYAEKVGAGEPIIFLPAAGFPGNEGLNIAEYLEEDFVTHMLDLPGLGKSMGIQARQITSLEMANWVKEYLDQQQIDKVSVIGHSLGGSLALAFAIHFPFRVNKLILLDQGHKPFPRIPTREFGLFAYAVPLLNIAGALFGKQVFKLVEPVFSNEDNLEERIKRFCDIFSIEENRYIRKAYERNIDFSLDMLNLYFGFYRLNMPKLLSQVNVPTYLAYATFKGVDEQECENTSEHVEKLQQHTWLPITYRPVESGHYVHWSDSALLADIKLFLEVP